MAASPIAAFPAMRTLVTVHLDGCFWANQGANRAACTFSVVVENSGQVAAGVEFLRLGNRVFRAKGDAEFASLAYDLVDFDIALHAILKLLDTSAYAKSITIAEEGKLVDVNREGS